MSTNKIVYNFTILFIILINRLLFDSVHDETSEKIIT